MYVSAAQKDQLVNFAGFLRYETIGEIVHQVKSVSDKLGMRLSDYKKLLTASVEALENIYRYRDHYENRFIEDPVFQPKFNIEKADNIYSIIASNPVKHEDINSIKSRIDKINRLDHDGLRKYYRKTILNGEFSVQGGAGLGLIEMAKITGGSLSYSFEEINSEFSYFTLTMKFITE